jgi:hypothetical protein
MTRAEMEKLGREKRHNKELISEMSLLLKCALGWHKTFLEVKYGKKGTESRFTLKIKEVLNKARKAGWIK